MTNSNAVWRLKQNKPVICPVLDRKLVLQCPTEYKLTTIPLPLPLLNGEGRFPTLER